VVGNAKVGRQKRPIENPWGPGMEINYLRQERRPGLGRKYTGKSFLLSPGEIHFLWWFIQGSIMFPSTRERLRKAWGFCGRHAWGALLVEASFRHGYMHGPAILYEDIMEKALLALAGKSWLKRWQTRMALRPKGPCLMCEMNYGPDSRATARPEIIQKGQDPTEIKKFCQRTKKYWEQMVCGQCAESNSLARCREHLLTEADRLSAAEFKEHQNFIRQIYEHICLYSRSFRWEFRGTESPEDEAALISAVGWCSGWQPLLAILELGK